MPPLCTPRMMVQVEAAGQTYKQVQSFTYLGGAVVPDMSVEIARRTRACWMRIKRYLRELCDQPKRGSTIEEGGDTAISSPGRSPKQPLPGIGLRDPLHGRQACPEFIASDQGVGQIYPW